MTGRLWAEAKALAALAESYGRLSEKRTGGGGPVTSVDDVPLDVIVEINMNRWSYMDRMRLPERADESHPDQIARRRYWADKEKAHRMAEEIMASMRRKSLDEARVDLAAEETGEGERDDAT